MGRAAKGIEELPEPKINWQDPDWGPIMEERIARLHRLREQPESWAGLKEFYRDHPQGPVRFIGDWLFTYDPRNPEIGKPSTMPFVMFKRQREFIEWLHEGWREREDGVGEKCRDVGASWLCISFAIWMWLFHPETVIGFGSRKEEYVDDLGDPKSLFWKARFAISMLPVELQPAGWDAKKHAPFMSIRNPENGAVIVGEAGTNIGRGARTSIYFVDEAAFLEQPELIEAALSMTTNCRVDVSTPNGSGNPFYRKRHGGKIPVFVFRWEDDPRKGKEWYEDQKAKKSPVVLAQEVDRDYAASVSDSFIDAARVDAAMRRGPADIRPSGGLRVGLDVARFGDDSNVLTFRRGRVMLKQVVWNKMDLMSTAGKAKQEIDAYGVKPEQIAVDTIGLGAGVADAMRAWYPDEFNRRTNVMTKIVVDVNSSLRLSDGKHYNLRAFMASQMKDWLEGAAVKKDDELRSELTAVRYLFRGGELLLESKDDMKKRGVKSPDRFDSLALTFAYPTVPKADYGKTKPYEPAVPGVGM